MNEKNIRIILKIQPPFHSEVQHPMWVNGGRIDA